MSGTLSTEGLRGLHLPTEPGWWPLGPAWWISGLAVLVLIAVIIIVVQRWRNARRWRVAAMAEWRAIEDADLNTPAQCSDVVRACSRLLRRIAITLRQPSYIAGLTGEQWLRQLDNLGQTSAFSSGVGRLLVDAPYKPEPPESREVRQLLELTRTTIRRAKNVPKHAGAVDD